MIYGFIKFARVKPLTDTKAEKGFEGFIGIVNKSKPKPNKLWVDQERAFSIPCNEKMVRCKNG